MALTPPAFRASATGTASEAGSVAIGAPSGMQVGDLMVAAISSRGGSLTAPAGWTHVRTQVSLSGSNYSVTYTYRKIAEAADVAATFTWTVGGGATTWLAGTIAAYSGVSPITPILESTGYANNALGTTITATPGASDVADVRVVVGYSASYSFAGSTPTITAGHGTTRANPSADTVRNTVVDDTSTPATARSATTNLSCTTSSVLLVLPPRFYETPNAPILETLVSGSFDIDQDQTLDWTPSFPDSGDVQTAAEARWRIDGGAWTTIAIADATSQTTIAGGTVTAGSFEWQARVKGTNGVFGSWSPSGFATATQGPAAPTFVDPTDLATIVTSLRTVTISHPDAFTHVRVQTVADDGGSPDLATVYSDTGWTVNATGVVPDIPFPITGRNEHIVAQVRVGGLDGVEGSIQVQVEFTPPPAPTVQLAATDSNCIQATIVNPAPGAGEPALDHNDLWRREVTAGGDAVAGTELRVAADLAEDAVFVDVYVAHRTRYEYRANAFGTDGSSGYGAWQSELSTFVVEYDGGSAATVDFADEYDGGSALTTSFDLVLDGGSA